MTTPTNEEKHHLFKHYRSGKTYVLLRADVLNADNALDGKPENEKLMVQYQALGEAQTFVAPIPQFFGSVTNPEDPSGPPIRRYQPI